MSAPPKSVLTWGNFARHFVAYFLACFCIGLFILMPSAMLELLQNPTTMGKPDLVPFLLGMSLFMGAFYAMFGGLFVLSGLFIGVQFKLVQWWFSAIWASASALAIARLFHDRSQNLDMRFYLAVAFAGFLAGLIYWRIAIKPRLKTR